MGTTTLPASMPSSTSLARFEDDTDNSSISGFSDDDSEWTQVSQSEDEGDPYRSATSDHDTDSLDGGPWEGLLPETLEDAHDDDVDQDHTAVSCSDDDSLGSTAVSVHEEDHMINAVLDSSLTGTLELRARSVSGSIRSIRSLESSMSDSQNRLRLSFPDPLTPSEEDIRRLSGDVPPSSEDHHQGGDDEESHDADADNAIPDNEVQTAVADSISSLAASVDEGSPSTPAVSEVVEVESKPSDRLIALKPQAKHSLSIVLYGSGTSAGWSIAEHVIKLLFSCDEHSLLCDTQDGERIYKFSVGCLENSWRSVQVVDATSGFSAIIKTISQPSIGILLLPSSLPSILPEHSFYLPIASQPTLDLPSGTSSVTAFSWQIVNDTAQYSWEQLAIPDEKLLFCRPKLSNMVIDERELSQLDRYALNDEAMNVLSLPPKRRHHSLQATLHKGRGTIRVALFAVIAAGLFSGMLRVEVPSWSKLTSKATDHRPSFAASLNASVILPTSDIVPSTALITSSLKDFAMTVFQPIASTARTSCSSLQNIVLTTTKSLIETTARPCAEASGSCQSSPRPWLTRPNMSRDVALRPASTVHVPEKPARAVQVIASTTGASASARYTATQEKDQSIATFFQGALSTVFNTNALIEVVSKDLRAIFEAIDELLLALGRQVDIVRNQILAKAGFVQGVLGSRNEHARHNAKQLWTAGGMFFTKSLAHLERNNGLFENVHRAVGTVRKAFVKKSNDKLLIRQMLRKKMVKDRKRGMLQGLLDRH